VSVQRVFRSKNFKIGLPFSNAAHYSNPEVDRLLEAASVETNEAKRQPFIQFQQIVHDDIPSIEFGANPSITVVSKKIGEYGPTGGGLKGNFASLYILH
jgi:peptide/nickel transport system substrate-binding protein